MTTRSELFNKLDAIRHNPSLIQQMMIDQVERSYSGELEIVDPMNPFVFLMEAAATLGADGVRQSEILTRRQYASAALTFEDLYLHMSDKDYIGRFATPAQTTLTLLLGKDEVYAKAVPTGSGGVRKLTIPRHTTFTVGGMSFGMQYPIDIRIMSHGGLQIVYNNDQPSPLYELESNQVEWSVLNYNAIRTEFICIKIPVYQFATATFNASLNASSGFKKTYNFVDQYYHCRVYMSTADGSWKEIRTTHSEQVFDSLTPTVVLKVVGQSLTVQLPQVYYTTGLVTNELRIDVYTTKGPLELSLQSYAANDFVANFVDREMDEKGKYIAPLTTLSNIGTFGDGVVSGGSNGLTFEELRERVMNNASGSNDIAVTNAQLSAKLQSMGFSSVKYQDNITNLVYLATRMLPKPSAGELSTGAGATMGHLTAAFEDLVTVETVMDNGERITLLPNTLFKDVNGKLEMPDRLKLAELASLSGDKLADAVNADRYLVSPFHYVLDITGNAFETRPYYFGNPSIKKKLFIDENDTVGVGVSTMDHEFTRTDSGWRLVIRTNSGEGFKALDDENVFVQLRFKPVGEVDFAYLNGALLATDPSTKERYYEFLIDTNWDVDRDDHVAISNFTMYDTNPRVVYTPLETEFDLTFVVANPTAIGLKYSTMDAMLGGYLLPSHKVALYEERLTLKLGDNVDGMWTRSRTLVGPNDYQRYTSDVYETYRENVYLRNSIGGAVITVVDGKPTFTVLHRAGDQVLDGEGNPVVLHRAGDPMLDEHGQPIIRAPRKVLRMTDLFVMDGAYHFATTDTDVQYKTSVAKTIVGWLNDLIGPMETKLLENTEVYYYPRSTIGLVNALINEEEEVQLYAEQDLTVTYYVSQTVYRDSALREIIADRTVETLATLLNRSSVNATELVATLKATMGDDVITVELAGLGGSASNIPVITLRDESSRLCIGKRLMATPDGQYEVKDAVTVEFIRHRSL